MNDFIIGDSDLVEVAQRGRIIAQQNKIAQSLAEIEAASSAHYDTVERLEKERLELVKKQASAEDNKKQQRKLIHQIQATVESIIDNRQKNYELSESTLALYVEIYSHQEYLKLVLDNDIFDRFDDLDRIRAVSGMIDKAFAESFKSVPVDGIGAKARSIIEAIILKYAELALLSDYGKRSDELLKMYASAKFSDYDDSAISQAREAIVQFREEFQRAVDKGSGYLKSIGFDFQLIPNDDESGHPGFASSETRKYLYKRTVDLSKAIIIRTIQCKSAIDQIRDTRNSHFKSLTMEIDDYADASMTSEQLMNVVCNTRPISRSERFRDLDYGRHDELFALRSLFGKNGVSDISLSSIRKMRQMDVSKMTDLQRRIFERIRDDAFRFWLNDNATVMLWSLLAVLSLSVLIFAIDIFKQ